MKTFNILEYLPKRYNATEEQEQNRQICYRFKDGYLSDFVKNSFLAKIREITGGCKLNWLVCFIPASTSAKTERRFSKLAEAIEKEGYDVEFRIVYNKYDTEAGHISGKSGNPIEAFGFNTEKIGGKNIILIDDIITRGTTFNQVANKLNSLGALSVAGLFLARTINPDYHPHNSVYDDFDPESYYEEEYEPDYYEEETYERYRGSYAQDIEGWSDEAIDEVFDGDPDAYWNID